MSWEISWALCRACMDADSELFPLYDDSKTNESDLSNRLAELAEIEISIADGLPTKLCEQCILKIIAYCEFKELVQDSDRKLRSIITEISCDTKIENEIKKEMDEGEEELENRMEKQLEYEAENQIEKQIEVKMKVESIEDCNSFNSKNEISTVNAEKHCCEQFNFLVKKDDKSSDNTENNLSNGQNFPSILKPNMWQIVHAEEKTDTGMDTSSALPFSFVEIKEEEKEQESVVIKNDKRRQTPTKAKKKRKKIEENVENFSVVVKETNNISDSSDFEGCTEYGDNIVGSLNDTITKVKEIREEGKDTCYQCTLCLQNYPVLSEALSHIVEWHVPVDGPFYCVVCEKDCESIKHLKNHVKIHKGDNPYICFLCNKAYTMKRYLKRHMVCHIDFPRHRCTKCGERFNVKTDLESHVKSHIQVAFKCSQCSREFNHKGNYKRHLISHLDPQGVHIPKYPCNMCNKRFVNHRALDNHKRVHTGEKPFKCEVCDKAFSQKGNLLNHAKVHTNPRRFVCEECGKKFNQKATLREHFKLHTGEKSYVCSVCGAAFTFSAALKRHMWSHSDKRPYACDICGATFVGKYDLNRHQKIHDGHPKRKNKLKQVNEDKVVEFSKDVINIVEETVNGNTIVIEQIFLCDDTIEIISQEESGKENADSMLSLL